MGRPILVLDYQPLVRNAVIYVLNEIVSIMKRTLRQFNWRRLSAIGAGIFGLLCLTSGVTVVLQEFPKWPAVAPAHWWLDHGRSDLVVTSVLMFTITAVAVFVAWVLWPRSPLRPGASEHHG